MIINYSNDLGEQFISELSNLYTLGPIYGTYCCIMCGLSLWYENGPVLPVISLSVHKSFGFLSGAINHYLMAYSFFNLIKYTWRALLSPGAFISSIHFYLVIPTNFNLFKVISKMLIWYIIWTDHLFYFVLHVWYCTNVVYSVYSHHIGRRQTLIWNKS